jgi:hypothetical protein
VNYATIIPESSSSASPGLNESNEDACLGSLSDRVLVRVVYAGNSPCLLETSGQVIAVNGPAPDGELNVVDLYLTHGQLEQLVNEGALKSAAKGLWFLAKMPFKMIGWLWKALGGFKDWLGKRLSGASLGSHGSYGSSSRGSSSYSSGRVTKAEKETKQAGNPFLANASNMLEIDRFKKEYPVEWPRLQAIIDGAVEYDVDRATKIMNDVGLILANLSLVKTWEEKKTNTPELIARIKKELQDGENAGWKFEKPNLAKIISGPDVLIASRDER